MIDGGRGQRHAGEQGRRREQDMEGRGKRLLWTGIVGGDMATALVGRRSDRLRRRRSGRGRRSTLTPSRRWRSQRWKEGGRGGIADCCHHRRRTRRRRKVNEGAQAAATKTTATVEEDEAEMITAIDIGDTLTAVSATATAKTTAMVTATAPRCLRMNRYAYS